MTRKNRGWLCGFSVVVALVTAIRVEGQATANGTRPRQVWQVPRTIDGQPDLQGVWVSNTATPLERPKEVNGRERLTDEEVAELQRRADRIFALTSGSDFAPGDAVFMAAWNNIKEFHSPAATASADAMIRRIFENRTSQIEDPPDGRIPDLTPEARQKRSERTVARGSQSPLPGGPEDLSMSQRCITFGVPMLGGSYGAGPYSYYQIFQSRDAVVLFAELNDESRIIPLDGRPHLPGNLRQWNGDSRGHWEGDTLVVDTTNFSPKNNFMGSGENLHLVERFTRSGPDRITYEITIDDPTTWVRPWTARLPLARTDEPIYEFACHEGNYDSVIGQLKAARFQEAAKDKP
jgi:hypothetical protein